MKVIKGLQYSFILALLLTLLLPASIQAQSPLILTNEQDKYPLGLYLEILEDKDKTWTIEDVNSAEFVGQFVPSQDEVPNFGFTDSAFWVQFRTKDLAND